MRLVEVPELDKLWKVGFCTTCWSAVMVWERQSALPLLSLAPGLALPVSALMGSVWPQSIVLHVPGGYRCQNWWGDGRYPKALIPQKGLVLMRCHQIHSRRRRGGWRYLIARGLANQESWGKPQILISTLLPFFWNKELVPGGALKTFPFSRADYSLLPSGSLDPLPLAAPVFIVTLSRMETINSTVSLPRANLVLLVDYIVGGEEEKEVFRVSPSHNRIR